MLVIGDIRPLGPSAESAAAAVLARAFRDSPTSQAVIGGDARHRLRSNRHGMRQALRGARRGGRVLGAFAAGEEHKRPRGVLVSIESGCFPPELPSLLAQLHSVAAQGLRVATRWGEVYRALADIHPREPHSYLSLLGVDPPSQRGGVGRALLEKWLEDVDSSGRPSYLETDLEANVDFYGGAGFVVREETRVLGVRIWCLWREERCE